MNIERLDLDDDERDDEIRCSAKLSFITRDFWRGKGRPQNPKGKDTCDCFAKYKIGERYFCRKHAGAYVLDNFSEVTR